MLKEREAGSEIVQKKRKQREREMVEMRIYFAHDICVCAFVSVG